ncbi:MAG: WS/DGAT/MGAT family O-acyltransferase [Myxococcaceae bacterium]
MSSLDFAFLNLEDRTKHMHVAGLALFEGPCPDYDELLRLVESRLSRVPRYRQRLAWVSFQQGRPVWVDEAQFDLEYHVRHTALPAPGTEDQLLRLTGRLMAQQLDRSKPLWEMWLIEGVGQDRSRFAIFTKTHHCMVDGISGMDIGSVLMDGERVADPTPPGEPWRPRPAPSPLALLRASVRQQITQPVKAARDLVLKPGSDARTLLAMLAGSVKPLLGLAQMGKAPGSSLNVPIGPHRRFCTAQLSLADIKRVRTVLGGTVNDVLLTVVAGALRGLLLARRETVGPDLRALVPVSVRGASARGSETLGNQVIPTFCALPVGEADPRRRLERVRESMKGLKESGQVMSAVALTRLSDFAPPTLLTQSARLQAVATRFFNLVVTNVPGPQFPLYLLGRQMLECYPAVPLAALQTLCVGLLSYNGQVGVGLLGDADAARDLSSLAENMTEALAELVACAEGTAASPSASGAVQAASGDA